MSKISKFTLGAYQGGSHWTRDSPVLSLNVALTNGETAVLRFSFIETHSFQAHTIISIRKFQCTS